MSAATVPLWGWICGGCVAWVLVVVLVMLACRAAALGDAALDRALERHRRGQQ